MNGTLPTDFTVSPLLFRMLVRLLAALPPEQVDQLTDALEAVAAHGYGSVTVRYRNGKPWLIDLTLTNNLKE